VADMAYSPYVKCSSSTGSRSFAALMQVVHPMLSRSVLCEGMGAYTYTHVFFRRSLVLKARQWKRYVTHHCMAEGVVDSMIGLAKFYGRVHRSYFGESHLIE